MRLRSSFVLALILVAACAETTSTLSPAGEAVRVSTEQLDGKCHALGEVRTEPVITEDTLGEDYRHDEEASARNRLRNEAARLGGNAIFIDAKAHPDFAAATAYKCDGT